MKSTNFPFWTESNPGSISRANILKIKSSRVLLINISITIINSCMKITHLTIFLDIKAILHISSNSELINTIDGNLPVPLWSFKNM